VLNQQRDKNPELGEHAQHAEVAVKGKKKKAKGNTIRK